MKHIQLPFLFLVCTFLMSLFPAPAKAQTPTIDNLKEELEAAQVDSSKIRILNDLCWEFIHADPEQAIHYGNQSLALARNTSLHLLLQDGHRYIGRAYAALDRTDSAMFHFETALSINPSIGKKDIGLIKNDIAIMYESDGDYAKALSYYYDALRSFDEIDFLQGAGLIRLNMCNIYIYLYNPEKSLEIAEEAEEIYRSLESDEMIGVALLGKALAFQHMDKDELSLKANLDALEIFERGNNLLRKAEAINELGALYQKMGDLDKALEYYQASLEIDDSLGNVYNVAVSYANIGSIYAESDQYDTAVVYFEKALEIAKEQNSLQWFMTTIGYIAESYYQSGRYDLAYHYQLRYDQIKDSVYSESRSAQIVEITEKYETEKKEEEIKRLNSERKADESKIFFRNTLIVLLSVLFILMIIVVIQIFRIRKAKEQKRINDIEHKVLRAQMNPHFIFNCLNSIQRLYVEGKEDLANDYMADFSSLLRKILENSGLEKISLKKEIESTKLYLDLEQMRTDEQFDYTINVDPNIDLINRMVPPLIIQPYVENAIWHGIIPKNEKGHISINFKISHKGHLEVNIIDDGVGFSHKKQTPKENSSKGMSITQKRLGGEKAVEIEELQEGGTKITLRIE